MKEEGRTKQKKADRKEGIEERKKKKEEKKKGK